MHDYDSVLKALLTSPQNTIFERITGARIGQWLNVELPEVQQTRVDLLGQTADWRLIALELQSSNDPKLALRMAEYALRIYRRYGRFPEQYVLYVGTPEMGMSHELVGPNFYCRYKLFDIRSLDEEALLNSPFDADNIIAILGRHGDRRENIRRILARIATLEGGARDAALKKLTILAGIRKLGESIRTEVKHMPILDSMMDHDLLGPAIREGLLKGREEGRKEGEVAFFKRQLVKRFGKLPVWAEDRLSNISTAEMDELSFRIADAKNIDELFER